MSVDDFESASQIMYRLEARAQLLAINSATFPHAKKSWQDKYHKSVRDLFASKSPSSPGESMTMEDLTSVLSGGSR